MGNDTMLKKLYVKNGNNAMSGFIYKVNECFMILT